MALDPLELGIIAVIGLVLFIWGPQKIPEMARALGRARKEFDAASKEFQAAAGGLQSGTSSIFMPTSPKQSLPPPPPAPAAPVTSQQEKTGDELLIDTARQLGIHTQGKTREQIQAEIINKAKSAQEEPGGADASRA